MQMFCPIGKKIKNQNKYENFKLKFRISVVISECSVGFVLNLGKNSGVILANQRQIDISSQHFQVSSLSSAPVAYAALNYL